MRRWFSSLRFRLVVLVLFAVIPAFGMIVYNALEERQQEKERAGEDALRLTQIVAAQQGSVIEGARQLFVGLAQAPQVLAGDVAACRSYLAGVNSLETEYIAISLATLEGDIACSSVELDGPVNIRDREYVQRMLQTRQFTTGEYIIARGGLDVPTLPFAYPVTNQTGEITGILVSGLNLTWLNSFAAQTDLPEGTALSIVDRNGVLLVRYPDPAGFVGNVIPESSALDEVAANGEAVVESSGLDGVSRLYAFAPLNAGDGTGAYVRVGFATSSLYASLNERLIRNLSLLAAVALLALLAAWFGGDWFVLRGVRALVGASSRLGGGDLQARTGLEHNQGEVGQLARAFDEMSEALERRERERHAAEAALRETEERFRLLVEGVNDYAILMLDPRGLVMSWNVGAERLKGYTAEEIIGQHFSRFYPEEDVQRGKPEHELRTAAEEGRYENEGWRVRRDGSRFWANVIITPVRDAAGHLRGFSKITKDITERKQAEERLKRTMEDLGRSNAELEQFAYVASHDLQEPLRMVGNYTQLLARRYAGKLGSDADDFINYAVDGAKRMQTLINDLLAFSRVGRRGKELAPTDAEAVLQRTLRDLSPAVADAHAQITHDPLPVVQADCGQLGQLFQNLIGNAIKFHGAGPPQIHVSARRDGNGYVFSVADTGIGIAPEYFDTIFVIFQRLHDREQYSGTGIGLAMCKKIVERHGGRIWVESEPEKGTTFYFTLRAAQEAMAAA